MPESDSLKKDFEINEPGTINYPGTPVYTALTERYIPAEFVDKNKK